MSDYSVKQIGGGEFDQLLPLMNDCFGMDVNVEYFRWKYLDNPAGPFIGFIALSKEKEVAAYYGVIPERYQIDGEERIIYQSCDTMTHSKHRRRGLFQLLAKHCYEFLRRENKLFIIGFGGASSTPGFLKFGWKKSFDLQYIFYPRIFALLNFDSGGEKYNIQKLTSYEDIEPIVQQSNEHHKIHSVKDLKSFTWRVSNPLRQYETYGIYNRNKEATAYLCFYDDGEKLFLFDFFAQEKPAEKFLFRFLKHKMKTLKRKGIVSLADPSDFFGKKLKANGFVVNNFNRGPLREKLPFIFYAPDDELIRYEAANNWYVTPFDHDSV